MIVRIPYLFIVVGFISLLRWDSHSLYTQQLSFPPLLFLCSHSTFFSDIHSLLFFFFTIFLFSYFGISIILLSVLLLFLCFPFNYFILFSFLPFYEILYFRFLSCFSLYILLILSFSNMKTIQRRFFCFSLSMKCQKFLYSVSSCLYVSYFSLLGNYGEDIMVIFSLCSFLSVKYSTFSFSFFLVHDDHMYIFIARM